MSWETFLDVHWGAIAATDFFSVEVLTRSGLIRYFVLFEIDLKTRKVEIAGILPRPNGEWNLQGLDNRLIKEPSGAVDMTSAVVHHERLGGVLNYYERRAA